MRWLAIILLFVAMPAAADSWMPPSVQTYRSADGNVRLTITPRGIQSPLAYFEDKVDGREPAGQQPNATERPMALIERRIESGAWERAWSGPLVNDVAPVSALVANSGAFATFDNWHMVGWGDDAIVIYTAEGRVVRAMGLTAILAPAHIEKLPRSVSSIYWGEGRAISDDTATLDLSIAAPGRKAKIPLQIDMATGNPRTSADQLWSTAQALAAAPGEADATTKLEEEADKAAEVVDALEAAAAQLEAEADALVKETKPTDRKAPRRRD